VTVKVAASMVDIKRRELKAAMVARSCEDMEPLRTAIERAREVGLEASEINNAARILNELEMRTQALAFTDVPRVDIQKLQACRSREEILQSLKTLMKLKEKDGFRAEVLAEYHFQNFMFCQRQSFGPEKASALLSMMRVLHAQTVVEKKADIEEAKSLLEELLARHSRQLPPFSVGIFSKEEVSLIRAYASKTFLRHFKMFQFMYQQRKDLNIRTVECRVTARVAKPADLHVDFELNPSEVPELQAFLRSEAADDVEDKASDGVGAEAFERRPPQSVAEAKLSEVMDAVVKEKLGDLETRMASLPL